MEACPGCSGLAEGSPALGGLPGVFRAGGRFPGGVKTPPYNLGEMPNQKENGQFPAGRRGGL